ncbi:MAG: thioredoxin family protein [Candidatus Hodarchaeales archaeon]
MEKIEIKIYGTGCKKCQKLEENTKKAILATGLNDEDYKLVKVTDTVKIVEEDVLLTPSLSINGKLVFHGKVASEKAIEKEISQFET